MAHITLKERIAQYFGRDHIDTFFHIGTKSVDHLCTVLILVNTNYWLAKYLFI